METAAQAPRQSNTRKFLLQMLGGMVAGAVFGGLAAFFLIDSVPRLGLSPAGKVAMAAVVVAAFPLLVGLHELGHLLGGMAVGFRPLLFMVGPLRIERDGERFRAKLSFKGAMFGGLAACAPTDTRDLRRRTLWLIAGGPLASLAGGLFFLALRPLLDAPPLADALLLIAGLVSLLIAMIAAIPGNAGGFYSDGARIIRLLRGGPDVEREVAVIAIMGLSMGGARAREWSPELVARATAGEPDTLFGVAGRLYAFSYELDHGRVDAARAQLGAVLAAADLLPKQALPSVLLQAALFAARADRDAPRARELLGRAAGGVMVPPHLRPMAEAAIAILEGDRARAAERLEAAEAGLRGATDPGGAARAAEEIAEMRGELAA
ncbi:MAG TPA: hypothetical protein VF613_09060 [Longimicrobium sp.]